MSRLACTLLGLLLVAGYCAEARAQRGRAGVQTAIVIPLQKETEPLQQPRFGPVTGAAATTGGVFPFTGHLGYFNNHQHYFQPGRLPANVIPPAMTQGAGRAPDRTTDDRRDTQRPFIGIINRLR